MYGGVIDSTCIYWSEQCGYHGNCLLYDLIHFRYRYVGAFSSLSVLIILTLCAELCQPRPTQPSIPPGSVNEDQLRLGRQRQVWFIPLADECGVCTNYLRCSEMPHYCCVVIRV